MNDLTLATISFIALQKQHSLNDRVELIKKVMSRGNSTDDKK